jgi:hypothetical protein
MSFAFKSIQVNKALDVVKLSPHMRTLMKMENTGVLVEFLSFQRIEDQADVTNHRNGMFEKTSSRIQ